MLDIPLEGDDAAPNSPMRKLLERAAPRQLPYSETTLTANEVDELELWIQNVSSTVKLVTKVNGTLKTVTLS